MKIVHVIESLPGGGAERVAVELARAQREAGNEVAIASIRRPDAEDPVLERLLAELGIGLFRLGKTPKKMSFKALLSLIKIIKGFDAGIVHTHGPSPDIYGCLAAIMARRPFVRTFHAIGSKYRREVILLERFLSLFSRCDAAVSESVREWVSSALKIDGKKVRTVYNGVKIEEITKRDMEKVSSLRKKYGGEGVVLITSTGRLNGEKGVDVLIRAAKILAAQGLNIRVVIAGEGAERENLSRLIASLGLEGRVFLPGYRADVYDLLAASDIFALPSFREGHSMSLVEAMAAGLPAIAGDLDANREVLGEHGCYFRCGDEQSLAGALQNVIDDAALRENLGSLSKERAALFSFERMMREYSDIYSKACAG